MTFAIGVVGSRVVTKKQIHSHFKQMHENIMKMVSIHKLCQEEMSWIVNNFANTDIEEDEYNEHLQRFSDNTDLMETLWYL